MDPTLAEVVGSMWSGPESSSTVLEMLTTEVGTGDDIGQECQEAWEENGGC